MSEFNFKLKEVINGTVDNKLKPAKSLAAFYEQNKKDISYVGRVTTYDVVGQRNYKIVHEDKKYKF